MLNLTAISFTINAILSLVLTASSYFNFKKNRKSQIGKSFMIVFTSLTIYFFLGAIAGLFFYHSSFGLNFIRILKEITQGVFTAFILQAALLLFYNFHLVKKIFYSFIFLWIGRIFLDIFLLGEPLLLENKVIEWDVHPLVFLINGVLQGLVFILCGYLFFKKAKTKWENRLFRVRTLFISTAVLVAALVIILPLFITQPIEAEAGHGLALVLLIIGLSIKPKNV